MRITKDPHDRRRTDRHAEKDAVQSVGACLALCAFLWGLALVLNYFAL